MWIILFGSVGLAVAAFVLNRPKVDAPEDSPEEPDGSDGTNPGEDEAEETAPEEASEDDDEYAHVDDADVRYTDDAPRVVDSDAEKKARRRARVPKVKA